MSLRVRTKPVFVFFLLAATKGTHILKAAAAGAVALAVAGAATTPNTWPRSTPKITETDNASRDASPRTIQTAFFFLVRPYFFWPDRCSAGRLLFFLQFFRAAVVASCYVPSFYIFLGNHSVVIQPHPTKGAEIYCGTRAGGILAATQVCCAGCTLLCAGRCARRLFVLLVVPFFVVLTVLFQRPRVFPRDATAAVTGCSSLCTLQIRVFRTKSDANTVVFPQQRLLLGSTNCMKTRDKPVRVDSFGVVCRQHLCNWLP